MDYEMNGIPLGLSMALLMNEQAKAGYDAGSKEEMDRIISSIYPAESVESLFEEPDID